MRLHGFVFQGDQEEHFAAIVQAFSRNLDILPPTGPRSGAPALQVNDTIFAMLSSQGEYVVKLPRWRVEALVPAGDGECLGPRARSPDEGVGGDHTDGRGGLDGAGERGADLYVFFQTKAGHLATLSGRAIAC